MKTLALFAALIVSAVSVPARAIARAQASAQAVQPAPDTIADFVRDLEPIILRADAPAFLALTAPSADRTRALAFASLELLPGARRVVVQERDRQPTDGNRTRVMLDVFADHGTNARITTWRLDLVPAGAAAAGGAAWRIADEDRLSSVDSLYRLALNPAKEYDARNLTVSSEDFDLTLAEGSVFVAEVDLGVTALVLQGRGEMRFHPSPATEQGQVRIFCGAPVLTARFDAAYVRLNPADFATLVDSDHLTQRPAADPRDARRADEIFREEAPKSYLLDLGDLSRDAWTLMPPSGDIVAEVRTRKYDTLTYAKSASEAEDITLFDRKHQRNISVYASKQKLERRGSRFYNEDDLADYDIQHYDVDLAYSPERQWMDARVRVRLKVRSAAFSTLTMRLADPLVIRSISSDQFGRLFGIRVRNQNMVVINLPATLTRDTELTIAFAYSGRLEPQPADREAVTAGQPPGRGPLGDDMPTLTPEPNLLYSNRALWYPQNSATDYATATMRITVPTAYDCVASGSLVPGAPELMPARDTAPARKLYVFDARQPLRYLAFVVSKFIRAETATVGFDHASAQDGLPALSGTVNHSLNLAVEANPRQVSHGRDLAERAVDIEQYYTLLIGDSPYPSFTIALVESDLPGGHSPGYFAALNQPLPTSPFTWRNDPTVFANYPEFFAAHEIAHQWWGQAVGWRNYHEQWLSEGFAQYFAALYADHLRGDDAFGSIMRQMRKWAMADSDQGPVYLGYRLGHIRGDSRVFRALVYDKGAAVLHMLRRLVGDEAFFRGLQRYYATSRFEKAGTDELRQAMEKESGRPLDRFFDRWIYGATLPKVRVGYRVEGSNVVLRVEQLGDDIFDLPLTLTLQYADRKADVVVPVCDRIVEQRVPLAGTLRAIDFDKDDGELVDVVRIASERAAAPSGTRTADRTVQPPR